MKQLRAQDLAAWLADPARPAPQLLDVREPWETALCTLPDARRHSRRPIPTGR